MTEVTVLEQPPVGFYRLYQNGKQGLPWGEEVRQASRIKLAHWFQEFLASPSRHFLLCGGVKFKETEANVKLFKVSELS